MGIPICAISYKACSFGARQYFSHRSKSLSRHSHIDADNVIKPSSCKGDSATNNEAYLPESLVDQRDSIVSNIVAHLTETSVEGKCASFTNNEAHLTETSVEGKCDSSTNNKTRSFSTSDYIELSAYSAVSLYSSCYNLYNLRRKFETGQFSEAAVELRSIADSIARRTVSFT